jgi:hemoglobin/transferrin/lactoferrin receptor protein
MLLGCIHAKGQTILTLKNLDNQEPIESVALFSENPKAFVNTNSLGQADITAFKGSERIVVQRLGFKTAVVSFQELESKQFLFFLTPTNTHFDDVVVAATRWSQPGSKLPNRISILSLDDLLLQNPQTAADLLGSSGEVFIQKSQQGGGSPMIRGFSANRLLYAVDGIRMNNAIFRGGNLQNVISLDPFNVERAEVLFGPGSVLYGSDALGAVMSFNTLKPEFSLNDNPLVSGSATSRISTANNEQTNHFHVKLGIRQWASVTSITHNRFDDLRMGAFGPEEYLKNWYVQQVDSVDLVFENKKDETIRIVYEMTNIKNEIRNASKTLELKNKLPKSIFNKIKHADNLSGLKELLENNKPFDVGTPADIF